MQGLLLALTSCMPKKNGEEDWVPRIGRAWLGPMVIHRMYCEQRNIVNERVGSPFYDRF